MVPVEVAYHTAADHGRMVIWRSDKKSTLLTTNSLAPFLVPADTDTVRYAVFRYRLKDRRKWETLTVHQGNTMTYERDGDSAVLEEWLRAREFVRHAFGKGGGGRLPGRGVQGGNPAGGNNLAGAARRALLG